MPRTGNTSYALKQQRRNGPNRAAEVAAADQARRQDIDAKRAANTTNSKARRRQRLEAQRLQQAVSENDMGPAVDVAVVKNGDEHEGDMPSSDEDDTDTSSPEFAANVMYYEPADPPVSADDADVRLALQTPTPTADYQLGTANDIKVIEIQGKHSSTPSGTLTRLLDIASQQQRILDSLISGEVNVADVQWVVKDLGTHLSRLSEWDEYISSRPPPLIGVS